jgi:hypothetical protein
MSLEQKITEALSRTVCGGWDRGFLESILEQLIKGRTLSVKQKQSIGKVLARNGEEAQLVHNNWQTEYVEKYKEDGIVLATYHSRQPYYKPMAADILANRVPEYKKFLRMYNNKYSQKVLVAHKQAPRYEVNAHVQARANFNAFKDIEITHLTWTTQSSIVAKFKKHGGFILEVRPEVYSHAKGAKRYKILPIGSTIPVIIEERHLKLHRKTK